MLTPDALPRPIVDKFLPAAAAKIDFPHEVFLSNGGRHVEAQLDGLRDGLNLGNIQIAIGSKPSLLAGTPFFRDLQRAVHAFRDGYEKLWERTPGSAEPDPKSLDELYSVLREHFLPMLMNLYHHPRAAIAFCLEHDISPSLQNYLQLMDETLFLWSHLTHNNLVLTRYGESPGASEIFVPLVEPDPFGRIQMLNHVGRVQRGTQAFLTTVGSA